MSFLKRSLALVLFSFIYTLSNYSYASAEDALFLQNVAKQYMLAQFENNTSDVKYSLKVGKLDQNRDYGGKCPNYLTAQLQDKQIKKNNIVKITCSRKENPYTVLIPVNVTLLRPTLVATQNIAKGTIITNEYLEKSYVNENINTSSAVTDADLIIGAKARKDIRAGEQLRQSDFCVVAKGDLVTIEAVSANLQIKTQGVALEEGKLNDIISVRNSKSKKVIQAIVVSPNTVRVNF